MINMIFKLLGALYSTHIKGESKKGPDNVEPKPKTPWQKIWDSSFGLFLMGVGLSIFGYINLVTTTYHRGATNAFFAVIAGIVMIFISLIWMIVQSLKKKPDPSKKPAGRASKRYSK
jgi:hypothetical protein